MAKRQTEFILETIIAGDSKLSAVKIRIIGQAPKSAPYVSIDHPDGVYYFVQDKDLERLARNILKSLGKY